LGGALFQQIAKKISRRIEQTGSVGSFEAHGGGNEGEVKYGRPETEKGKGRESLYNKRSAKSFLIREDQGGGLYVGETKGVSFQKKLDNIAERRQKAKKGGRSKGE